MSTTTFRHQTANPVYDQNQETIMGGLSKIEYAAIHIMSGLTAKYSMNKPEDQKTLSKMSVELANSLFDELEK